MKDILGHRRLLDPIMVTFITGCQIKAGQMLTVGDDGKVWPLRKAEKLWGQADEDIARGELCDGDPLHGHFHPVKGKTK